MRIKKLGKFKSRAGYKKKKRDKERKAFQEKYGHHSQDNQERNLQTIAADYEQEHDVQYEHEPVHSYNHSVQTTAPNYQYSYHRQSTSYWKR